MLHQNLLIVDTSVNELSANLTHCFINVALNAIWSFEYNRSCTLQSWVLYTFTSASVIRLGRSFKLSSVDTSTLDDILHL